MIVLLALLTVAFRTYSDDLKWDVSADDPYLWMQFCNDDTRNQVFADGSFPQGDILAEATNLNFRDLAASVIKDLNSNPNTFLRIDFHPDEGGRVTDATFNSDSATNRIVEICFTDRFRGLAGANARFETNGNQITKCYIEFGTDSKGEKAPDVAGTLTHELGHCLGLDHAHDSRAAIMSYFGREGLVRFQEDDKAGIAYQYPITGGVGNESNTYGLGCAKR